MTVLSFDAVTASVGVYPPQYDSSLLISQMRRRIDMAGRSVLDLCTGSGVAAIAAAQLGAACVTAFDVCPDAVRCAQSNAAAAGVPVEVKRGEHKDAVASGPYDVVVCNPPYVPTVSGVDPLPDHIGPAWAWDAGPDGRLVLDPLCASTAELLEAGGTLLLVQSELADPRLSLRQLRVEGLRADIVAARRIPFGPVLKARARRFEAMGLIRIGQRAEQLVVIRADKP